MRVVAGQQKKYRQEPIAVVGMACRLPGHSNSPRALWEFLEAGGVAETTPPKSRFQIETHHDGSGKPKTMRSPGGMFLEDVDPKKIDAGFFGLGKIDAVAMDPQQRQLLEVMYECLENAGVPLSKLDGADVGCFVGSYAVDYQDMQSRDPDDRAPSVTIGAGRAILSNRISHFLNIHGPSMTIDTACSGSLVGLDVACRYLSSGEVSGCLVAGANLYMSPEHVQDSGPMKGAASPTARCHTFDSKADGYVKAEAVNCVYLKRLSDAIRDGDPVRAIIRGTATNSDGNTPGIASPSWQAQAKATKAAYANAGIADLSATGYIEMHGTGTQAGDPQEVQGVGSVFASSRSPDAPLIMGSIKSNVGHSEPAAGISGLIKAILAVEKGRIPGNPTFITPNPKIDFEGSRVMASRFTIPWPAKHQRQVGFRRASVNSFGYGGSNAHAIIDQVPEELLQNWASSFADNTADDDFLLGPAVPKGGAKKPPKLLVLSANDEGSVKAYSESLRRHLLDPRVKLELSDLAYTLSERRSRLFHRGYAVVGDNAKLSIDADSIVFGKKRPSAPKIGFVFTGQGAQWSQMGRSLLEQYPEARETIERLEGVLSRLNHPPSWSLYEELTEPRTPERLRDPELSQPLVTALQLAILSVLSTWGVKPEAVVGHSSGEIAAAYAAGHLSEEAAMTAAYYRGYAAKVTRSSSTGKKPAVGMMAAGLGGDAVAEYLSGHKVTIACYNSPSSVTLSGTIDGLEAVKEKLVADGKFARMLQVDMPYHSPLIADTCEEYLKCLNAEPSFDSAPKSKSGAPNMFSSVEGGLTSRSISDAIYWHSNMAQPVLFEQALGKMLSSAETSPDFLIEIGPSDALAGPSGQVIKALPAGSAESPLYCAASYRGKDAAVSLLGVAGKLFMAGLDDKLDLEAVNRIVPAQRKLVTDLPNYAWNHSTDYWYESESSLDWRYRAFPQHDLIGSKVLGTPWQAPAWKKSLKLEDLPWLKDHKLGPDYVFPGAGYMCMAIEGMAQTDLMLMRALGQEEGAKNRQFRLRNVTFDRALVLTENNETRMMLTLAPVQQTATYSADGAWYQWVVRSLQEDGSWVDHCKGKVRAENLKSEETGTTNNDDITLPLKYATIGAQWYKSMVDVGYNFGKSFRKLVSAETTSGSRSCRSLVDLTPPPSEYTQSHYHVHPAALDGAMQSCAPGLWHGIRSSVNAVLVPAILDDLVVRPGYLPTEESPNAVSVSESVFAGPGRPELTKNSASNCRVYDPETGKLVLKLTGLRYHMLDQDTENTSPYAAHRYSKLVWAPDVTLSPAAAQKGTATGWDKVQQINDLIAHKRSNAKVVEISLVAGDSSSAWLEGLSDKSIVRNAFGSFHLLATDAGAVVGASSKYEGTARAEFVHLPDLTKADVELPEETLKETHLVILRLPAHPQRQLLDQTLAHAGKLLTDDGHLIVLEQGAVWDTESNDNGAAFTNGHMDDYDIVDVFQANALEQLYHIDCSSSPSLHRGVFLAPTSAKATVAAGSKLHIVHLAKPTTTGAALVKGLTRLGWEITQQDIVAEPTLASCPKNATILVTSELETPQLPTLTEGQWTAIQTLLQHRKNRIVWLSKSAQPVASIIKNPDGAMIHGLCRSVRTEDPSMNLTTLDLEDPANTAALPAVHALLLRVTNSEKPDQGVEGEYAERGGIMHVSRILANDAVNAVEAARVNGAPPVEVRLHEAKGTVRMIAERVGSLDSLKFVEVAAEPLPLPDNKVEVKLFASALNFKDVAVAMGIVPENNHLLGLEGAGTIRRVGKNLNSPFHIGQRVLIFEKGTFANRIIATTERTIPIPDWLSYEAAATLPSVYLTALYSLFNLGGLRKGHKVLIHSGTGGLGVATIQICQNIGAEVYATVGNDTKKKFLIDTFGIPAKNIYNSRNTDFEAQLMHATNGYGVDIILNSLTGDLLDASWRCIAESGTMVELGKKDHIDRNSLAMEPFNRNASYRCFDMSHKCVTDQVIAVLMKQMMDMICSREVAPITPLKLFPYNDIPAAFRYMRGANHIGKIIICNKDLPADEQDPIVTVSPAVPKLTLRGDVSYLIIGGLKGLCGSLAVDMARHGARNIVVMARSGFDDERSQGILKNLKAEGCSADLIRGDVSSLADVRRAFRQASLPIGGVIQGAMVLRDRPFESMSHADYHGAIESKVAGTWNLHNVAIETGRTLDFFSMLSSISGLIGQPAQSNYAAANVFLDNFAAYRRSLGLHGNSVDLGAIEDVGYMAEHSELITALDTSAWTPINEPLFLKIVGFSILQQGAAASGPIDDASASHLISSIAVPQSPSSRLLVDARFTSLNFGGSVGAGSGAGGNDGNKEIQALLMTLKAGADPAAARAAALPVVNGQFMTVLHLDEPLEPAKPLSAYGLDSLAAVEFRNWARAKLNAELSTLDVTSAPSLLSLTDKIVAKIQAAAAS